MEKYYDTDGLNVYLILKDAPYQDSYEKEMLQQNRIPGILEMKLMSVDGEIMPCYNVNGQKEFAGSLEVGNLAPALVLSLFQNLFTTIKQIKGYLLNMNNLILEENFIFQDDKTGCCSFVYLPGYQENLRMQMICLLEKMINKMNHADRARSNQVYDLYAIIAEQNFDFNDLQKFLNIAGADKENGRFDTEQKQEDAYENEYDEQIEQAAYGNEYDEQAAYGNEYDEQAKYENKYNKQKRHENKYNKQEKYVDENNRQTGKKHYFMGYDKRRKQEDGSHKRDIYKGCLLVCSLATILFGLYYAWTQYKLYHRIEQMKPMVFVCMLLAGEVFVWLQLGKQNAVDSNSKTADMELPEQSEKEGKVEVYEKTKAERQVEMQMQPESETVVLDTEKPNGMLIPLDGCENQIIYLPRLPVLIGRGDAAGCRLKGRSVSRVHGKISYTGCEYILEDIDSTNGTYINDFPLQSGYPAVLLPGDKVAFGSETFEFQKL